MKSLLHIGADVEKTLPNVTKSIIQILETSGGDMVKCRALEVLGAMFKVENVTVQYCTFKGAKGGIVKKK